MALARTVRLYTTTSQAEQRLGRSVEYLNFSKWDEMVVDALLLGA